MYCTTPNFTQSVNILPLWAKVRKLGQFAVIEGSFTH